MAENESKSIFQRSGWVTVFALTAALAWGWAYPLIKLGFGEFGITEEVYMASNGGPGAQALTASKMLFAGIRFCCSGLIVLAIAAAAKRDFRVQGPTDTQKAANWAYIIIFALINTTFHYAFFYIGLSNSAGARAAILNSMGVFLVVIFACIFFESDKMTLRKAIGCCIGAAGIVALNLGGGGAGGGFTLKGDGMIILNACCSAGAGLMTRGLSNRIDVFVGTGYGLAIGGALLIIPGLLAGGYLPQITATGLGILFLLILISSLGFTLYNKLLSCNPVGKVAIYNSLIPVVGAITSCLCLHETFYWKYVVACALAAAGIYIINRGKS